jgi:hypothetical protein
MLKKGDIVIHKSTGKFIYLSICRSEQVYDKSPYVWLAGINNKYVGSCPAISLKKVGNLLQWAYL